MKIKFNKIFAIFLFALMVNLNSCMDNDLNVSPNAINEKNLQTKDGVLGLVIATQVGAADFYAGDRSRISSIWTWQMCAPEGLGRPQPVAWNGYIQQEDGPANDMWILGYNIVRLSNDILTNASTDIQFGADNEGIVNTIRGMAKYYKALAFGELATFYGHIPIDIKGVESPKFVSVTLAYNEVQKLLDEAIVHFQNGATLNRDLNFNGDGAKWQAACHTLKARYFLNIKNYSSAKSEAIMGITVASNNLNGIYTNTIGEFNPWAHWTNDEAGEPIRVDATFMRKLKAEQGDTRIEKYFSPNGADGGYYGYAERVNFVSNPDSNETIGKYSSSLKLYKAYNTPFPIATYEENVLILAEASARTGDESTALTNVNIIRKNAGLTDYSGSGSALIDEILNQKYLELFLQGIAYADMRRTGKLPEEAVPVKWIYPYAENLANPNVPKLPFNELVKELLP